MKMASKIRQIFFGSDEFRNNLKTLERKRRGLDDRLTPIIHATMNGDTEWFLKLAKENAECVMKVIEQCEEKK